MRRSARLLTEHDQERKRQTQSGVQAIFTTHQQGHRNAIPAVGLLASAGGVAIWIWAFRSLSALNGTNISQSAASSTLGFASFGMLIILAGTGLAAYSLAERRTRVGRNMTRFPLQTKNPGSDFMLDSPTKQDLTRQYFVWKMKSTRRVSNASVAGVAQSLVLIGLYGALVAEYNNNPSMQVWVQNSLPLVGDVLNYYGLLLLSGLLGVFVLQFVPERRSSR